MFKPNYQKTVLITTAYSHQCYSAFVAFLLATSLTILNFMQIYILIYECERESRFPDHKNYPPMGIFLEVTSFLQSNLAAILSAILNFEKNQAKLKSTPTGLWYYYYKVTKNAKKCPATELIVVIRRISVKVAEEKSDVMLPVNGSVGYRGGECHLVNSH